MMNLRRGSILIIAILVVAIVAVVGAYLFGKKGTLPFSKSTQPKSTVTVTTPEPKPSVITSLQPGSNTSWKIYKNTKYLYSITNPGGFYLTATNGEVSKSVIIANYDETKLTTQQIKNPIWVGKIKIEIDVLSEQEEKDSSNSMEIFYENEKDKLIRTGEISVDGFKAIRREYKDGKENNIYIKLFKNNFYYLLTFTYVDPVTSKDIDQIFSTIKFLQ